jgi:hypothetical protein
VPHSCWRRQLPPTFLAAVVTRVSRLLVKVIVVYGAVIVIGVALGGLPGLWCSTARMAAVSAHPQ